ncbi:EamA family transporter [Arthrobacter sp. RCC_34]|uniref:EamA family transporter n=1 Tax=Arthrobacter sp. RCC_34 TaxID=3239230 RepID=UPI0035256ED5
MRTTSASAGAAVVAVAVIWQGIGTALVSHTISPALGTYSTFTAFLLAALIGVIAKVTSAKRTPSGAGEALRMSRAEVIVLNLVTAGAFACFYVAATLIPATAASVIETGLGPIAVAMALLGTTRKPRTLLHPTIVLLAAAAVAVAVFGVATVDPGLKIAGILLSTIAGACAAGVLLISRRLAGRGIDALSISAARFHLAWVLCGAIALPTIIDTHQRLETLIGAAGISVIGISLPILLLQWGITKAKPLASAFIISALPAIVLAADTLLGAPLTPMIACTMGILVLVLLAGLRQPRKAQTA